LMQLAQGKVRW